MKTFILFGIALAIFAPHLLASATAGSDSFWTLDSAGHILHKFTRPEPAVLCMQGRKVVMQTETDKTTGLAYKARFFNILPHPDQKKKVIFKGGDASNPELLVSGKPWAAGNVSSVSFDGSLTLHYPPAGGVTATRTVYPSMDKALVIEEWQLRNVSGKPLVVKVRPGRKEHTVYKKVIITWNCPAASAAALKPGEVFSFHTTVSARLAEQADLAIDVAAERKARQALANAAWHGPGRLETPDPDLDAAFALQKLHVLECPVETCKGLITHNGSLTYSPGIWANDPVEYSSPLFPFFGDAKLNRASMNMYRIWQDYCKKHGIEPFPGSFEGPALKLTQRGRGDDAMVLYGLSTFLLFQGDRAAALELWPLIKFSAASVLKHTTADGIVASRTDEMEGRYPTGTANLSTSSLAYGGYRRAATLARAIAKPKVAAEFDTRADALRKSIESYFGAEVQGFKTYRYYKGNHTLRGWILLPLAMGIDDREQGTVAALVSDKLWPGRVKGADILAESNRPTEWGRETYYALRVLFKAGHTDQALDLTQRVVRAQIFGKNGPYPDEDAIDMLCPGSLYPRVFTEGVFGIEPTGLDSFKCTPRLPTDWPQMALRDVRAFGHSWDLVVERSGDQLKVTVTSGDRTIFSETGPPGTTYAVSLADANPAEPR